jgi:transposase
MSNSKKVNRPKYSLEFKQDATKLVLEKGYSHQQAADHLGISLSALGRWVRAERKPAGGELTSKKPGLSLADQDELIRLRKENEQLRMEREVLKKAAVFFAKEAE